MFTFRKKNTRGFIEKMAHSAHVISLEDREGGLNFLVSFFEDIRPRSGDDASSASLLLENATRQLVDFPLLKSNFKNALISQLAFSQLSPALTESGIPLAKGFWQEFYGRIKHKILPTLRSEEDFLYVVQRVFYRKTDYQWVEAIPEGTWIRFFESLELVFPVGEQHLVEQLLESLKILALQVAQAGLEKEITDYLPHPGSNSFLEQNYLVHDLETALRTENNFPVIASLCNNLQKGLQSCRENIDFIQDNHSQNGASLHQTYTLLILLSRIERMLFLIDIIDKNDHLDEQRLVTLLKTLVRNDNRRNSLREFMSQSFSYLAYQIAEHKGEKGNKYITSNRLEYLSMLRSAMWGGVIICFVAVVKNLLSRLSFALFWQGFLYSVNYSIGFLLIEETHSTLATKQPAFTASAVAASLDSRKMSNMPDLEGLAVTVGKVIRSQTASFLGNLLVVFPGTFLLAWLYHWFSGAYIVEGDKALQLLKDQHPWQSLSLLFACNTGVFLFLSGIIAGYIQNKILYGKIPQRLVAHPILRVTLPLRQRTRLAAYIEKHSGAIIGNISLGFMLGMASLVGKIFGLPFDIRHITISAGNVAIAAYGLGINNIPLSFLVEVLAGVLLIGFFNFLVSFSLAFMAAVKSRGIRLRDYPAFMGILWRYFVSHPLDFVRPPKISTSVE